MRPLTSLLLLTAACIPTSPRAPRGPATTASSARTAEGVLAQYDAGLAKTGYLPVTTPWASFTGTSAKLPFEATKGRCYKLAVVADLDDHGVVTNDTVARWGDLDYQWVKGERKFFDGDALFDLGCFQTGVVAGTPLRPTLSTTLALESLDEATPSFTARLYSQDVGAAEVDARWAAFGKQKEMEDRQTDGLRGMCNSWRARFNACTSGKRPKDYPRGASCATAAEYERDQYGAASCGAP